MEDKVQQIKELVKKLNKYSYEYYTLGQPTISDTTYDGLYDKLVQLENEIGVILSNSPTQNVGNEILSELTKVKHEYPMLSLDKVKEKDFNKLINFCNKNDSLKMLKLDGLTVSLTYENGELVRGETRGNGVMGEDITHNIKHFVNVPLNIPYKQHIVITGEAIITYNTFEKINNKLPENMRYKNPRNLVSGTVRQLDSKICKERKPIFIAYIVEGDDTLISKRLQFKFIEDNGFTCVPNSFTYKDDSEFNIKHSINELKQKAEELKYPIDGIVFMYNDIKYGKSLGNTSHHPLHSLAFKFCEDSELTTLRDVKWQVGRTNTLTPVAYFDTVELCGTSVSKASLHNIDIIRDLQIGLNDEISVIKSNEIIPQVIDNITKSNTLKIPKICPNCGSKTEIVINKESGKHILKCTNKKCSLVQIINHYCSRNAMNIVGLSKSTIKKFTDNGFINNFQDIYKLSQYKDEILSMDGFGEKSYNKLINNIEKSKTCKLENFIYSLGIQNVGLQTAKNMVEFANEYPTYNNESNAEKISLINKNLWVHMKDCGEILANSIVEYFNDEELLDQYNKLCNILNFEENNTMQKEVFDNPLNGKLVYPTGKFSLKKSELKEKLEKLGCKIANGYSKKLDYLICGGDTSKSGKVTKAKNDGIKLMTEEELMNIINTNK